VGAQHVGLQRKSVAITAGELDDRLDPGLDEEGAGHDRREVGMRRAVVGAVDRVDVTDERRGNGLDLRRVAAVGRLQLARDDEPARQQSFVQPTAGGCCPGHPSELRS
jgi:hypothetical protein